MLLSSCGTAPATTSVPSAAATPSAIPTPSASASQAPTAVAPPAADRGTEPNRIAIPDIDIDSQVVPVSTHDRILDIPPKPWVVGWWEAGVGPGSDGGTTVLVAHLDSRTYGAGPFTRAKDLTIGGAMTLRDAEGAVHRYVVARVETLLKQTLPYERLFNQSGPERVVLVTCGGEYRDGTGWDSNVVVTFTPS